MSQREGSGKNKSNDKFVDDYGADDLIPEPAPRRTTTPNYDEEQDLPPWGTQRSRPSSRETGQQGSSSKSSRRSDREPATSDSDRDPIPTLGDAFDRPARRQSSEPERSQGSSDQPAGRQRRTSVTSTRSTGNRQGAAYGDPYPVDEYDDEYVVFREPRSRRRATS
jgi:hypothetical protein